MGKEVYKLLSEYSRRCLEIYGNYNDQIDQYKQLRAEVLSSFEKEFKEENEDIMCLIDAIDRRIQRCLQMLEVERKYNI